MKRFFCIGLMAVASLPGVGLATEELFENRGIISTPITIDARAVVNYGQFNLATFYPYDTSGTLFYTNFGSMSGNNGFRLEHVSPVTGLRSLASSFINFNPGFVEAVSAINIPIGLTAGSTAPFPCYNGIIGPSYLYISATNIVTGAGARSAGASIIGGASGELRLIGQNVDLSDSGIMINPVWNYSLTGNGPNPGDGTFIPDVSIEDLYWAQTNFSQGYPLASAGIWNGFTAAAPSIPSPPTEPPPFPSPSFSISGPRSDSYANWLNLYTITLTNVTGDLSNVQSGDIEYVTLTLASNIYKGAIFAAASSDFFAEVGFSPSRQANNFFNDHWIQFSTGVTNAASGGSDPAFINILDRLASDTRLRGNYTNLLAAGCNNPTRRPANYWPDRSNSGVGFPGNNGYPDPRFYTSAGFQLLYPIQIGRDAVTNSVVDSGDFAGYGTYPDSFAFRPPVGFLGAGLPGTSETNYPGRVYIEASNLNLENARLRGDGLVVVKTSHLVSSVGTVMDCENISFDLNSTNGIVKVENLVPDTVSRMRGPIYLWSAVWTNEVQIIFTNNYILTNLPVFDPPGSTNVIGTNLVALLDPLTNFCTVGYAATIALAQLSASGYPVSVFDGVTRSRHTEINDNLSVVKKFLVNGRSLTVNGVLQFPGVIPFEPLIGSALELEPLQRWTAAVAPNLLVLTNNGTISIFNDAHFGDDRATPYASIINTGTVAAAGISIRSAYLQNNGTMTAQGALKFDGGVAKLEGSTTSSGNVTRFDAANVKFNRAQLTANGALVLNVAESITDAEKDGSNLFILRDGFQMLRQPRSGSLLRTVIQSIAPEVPSITVNHTWAAADFGPSEAGYQNNMAIGNLSLIREGSTGNQHWSFSPTGNRNAMYVDMLDLSQLPDITNRLHISENMVIYYAALRLIFTPPSTAGGIPQLPEEYMDGAFSGRLRWVRTYAGASSSVPVVTDGHTVLVNTALANSKIIDSDGDGVANYFDGVAPNGDKFKVSPLALAIVGNGTVTPDTQSQSFIVGTSYTLFAQPNDGSHFVGWSGGITSSNSQLTFTMQSNLTLTATFSYTPIAATYRGLYYEPEAVRFRKSGAVTLSTTTSRSVSGTLQSGNAKYSFKGQLDAAGAGSFPIPRSGDSTLTLQIQAGDKYVTGSIGDGDWSAVLSAGRNVYNAKSNPAPNSGKYTIILPGSEDPLDASSPAGDGYGAVTISSAGKVQFNGAMGDGTKFSLSSSLTDANQWALYASLYGGKGQALGWVTLDDNGFEDMGGEISWFKQADAAAKFYPSGFDEELHASGSTFNPLLSPLTGFNAGQARFAGGNVSPFSNVIEINANNKVVNKSPNKLSLKLNTSVGTFSGSAVDPATAKTIKFNGALHQKLGFGAGYFPGSTQAGSVTIGE